ncbi:Unknown protein [Striga hermonthica]|uniref:Galactose oxidase/kelch repeat superfamily protein n=1 Tax=Striga hermonthica TaxID=68872 RepID=A0A9N7P5F4_STRHE|nr:Unknown protein [Striga hermonthica]
MIYKSWEGADGEVKFHECAHERVRVLAVQASIEAPLSFPRRRVRDENISSCGLAWIIASRGAAVVSTSAMFLSATCRLSTMAWSGLRTLGSRLGPRDSHSACVLGHRMFVFGGNDGLRKVGELRWLDLRTGEWARPECRGSPPPACESHTTTVVGPFGNDGWSCSGPVGRGRPNYFNDLHILDLTSMEWSSPKVGGAGPWPLTATARWPLEGTWEIGGCWWSLAECTRGSCFREY